MFGLVKLWYQAHTLDKRSFWFKSWVSVRREKSSRFHLSLWTLSLGQWLEKNVLQVPHIVLLMVSAKFWRCCWFGGQMSLIFCGAIWSLTKQVSIEYVAAVWWQYLHSSQSDFLEKVIYYHELETYFSFIYRN